jgi:predicted O-methyltransferase YrrM
MSWIEEIPSAWKGHREFAEWLVFYMMPETVVELGVDYGYSSMVFANALEQSTSKGVVYGIDLFEGDAHAGFRNTYEFVMELKKTHELNCLKIIRGEFSNIATLWKRPIQILHIDGLHTYDAVKTDFETWSPFVSEDGIILFHDVVAFHEVGEYFDSLSGEEGRYKAYFPHSAGLGILTKNKELYEMILRVFPNIII